MKQCKHENKEFLSYIGECSGEKIAYYGCCDCRKIIIDLDEDDNIEEN